MVIQKKSRFEPKIHLQMGIPFCNRKGIDFTFEVYADNEFIAEFGSDRKDILKSYLYGLGLNVEEINQMINDIEKRWRKLNG